MRKFVPIAVMLSMCVAVVMWTQECKSDMGADEVRVNQAVFRLRLILGNVESESVSASRDERDFSFARLNGELLAPEDRLNEDELLLKQDNVFCINPEVPTLFTHGIELTEGALSEVAIFTSAGIYTDATGAVHLGITCDGRRVDLYEHQLPTWSPVLLRLPYE